MPLLKLWNSLRGRSNQPASTETTSAAEVRTDGSPNDPVSVKLADHESVETAPSPRRKSRGSMFRSRPHAALCRQLKAVQATSVLELGVGDGSRAVAVLDALPRQTQTVIRYAAIDQFELSTSRLDEESQPTLKDFFQIVRSSGITPRLFPETVDRGLLKVSSTVGAVDLVLISHPVEQWQNPTTLKLLSRVLHEQTLVMFHDGQQWHCYDQAAPAIRRAA